MSSNHELYAEGPARGAKAPILIAHLDGALDAGSAGTLAVLQLLRNLGAQRVATFDADQLIDYRSHRPIMEVEDWVTNSVTSPEIALDLIHDDQGQPILVLHGPEPDARWKALTKAIEEIAESAGVEAVFSFHGLPAAVPHTRPTTIHIQSTDRDMVPEQPQMGGIARFPSPYTSYLQHHMSQVGLTGVTLLATVPYYMAGSTFPRASSALIRRLSDMTGLSLPVGDLERGADEDASQVELLIDQNQELQLTVKALEQHYDSISGAAAEGVDLGAGSVDLGDGEDPMANFPTWEGIYPEGVEQSFPDAELLGDESNDSFAEAIGDAIENYLKTRSKPKRRSDRPITNIGNTAEPNQAKNRRAPRHRAPSPWEMEAAQWEGESEDSLERTLDDLESGSEQDFEGNA